MNVKHKYSITIKRNKCKTKQNYFKNFVTLQRMRDGQ